MIGPYLPSRFHWVDEGWRHHVAEYAREPGLPHGWYQDGRHLNRKKTEKAFIWPKDGKNGSTWGRLKDVLRNDGPDMYVAFGANKQDCVSNRPTRGQWSKQGHLENSSLGFGFNSRKYAPWTHDGGLGGRAPWKRYDFRTRKYIYPHDFMWSDAIWQPEPYRNRAHNKYPEAVRGSTGLWWQDTGYLPHFRGGPIDNEFGEGALGEYLPYRSM